MHETTEGPWTTVVISAARGRGSLTDSGGAGTCTGRQHRRSKSHLRAPNSAWSRLRGPLSETCDSRARNGTDTKPDGSVGFTRYRIRSITQLFGQARGWWLVCIVPGERPCSPLAGTKLNGEQPNQRRIVDHLQCHRRVQMSGMTSESPRPVCAR